jgi:hypothetical protein
MKTPIRSVVAALGVAICGNLAAAAELPKQPAPIVVKVAEIVREFEFISVRAPETKEEGRSNQTARLTFFFQSKPSAKMHSLFEDAARIKRLVHILDGTNLIAECSIIGLAERHTSDKEALYGLILGFASVDDAESAAIAMREDMDTRIRRLMKDRRLGTI